MYVWTKSEIFLYGGIVVMAAAGVLAIICAVAFTWTGRNLKKKLRDSSLESAVLNS